MAVKTQIAHYMRYSPLVLVPFLCLFDVLVYFLTRTNCVACSVSEFVRTGSLAYATFAQVFKSVAEQGVNNPIVVNSPLKGV